MTKKNIIRHSNKGRKRLNDIVGIIFISLSVLLTLGILTNERFLGELGTIIAENVLDLTFGYPVLVVPFLIFCWGFAVILKQGYYRIARLSFFCILAMVLASFAVAFYYAALMPEEESPCFGGIIGHFLVERGKPFLGIAGCIILWLTLTVVLFIYWFNISPGAIFQSLKRILTKIFSSIKTLFIKGIANPIKKVKILWRQKSVEKEISQKPVIREPKPKKEPEVSEKDEKKQETAETIVYQPPVIKEKSSVSERVSSRESLKPFLEPISEPAEENIYVFPSLDFLGAPQKSDTSVSHQESIRNAATIEKTLMEFGVEAKVKAVIPGPVITLYEVAPSAGVKISKIASLSDDLALAMKARGIRIIAPIPGKSVVGIEIPNNEPSIVYIRELLESESFQKSPSKLSIALGKTISGETYCTSIEQMPHLLIAGSTGSGKSVGINTIITSILYKARPDEVQFLMIDPKKLELSIYKRLKRHHLLKVEGVKEDVITHPNNAKLALRALELEMERRYQVLSKLGVRNICDYNEKIPSLEAEEKSEFTPLSYIVLIIDELADLMLTGGKDIEEPIARLAQMSRAVGIHIVLATQRPSVNVLTGVIKANFSTRLSYQVAQRNDSRVILDMNGAEQLLGKGDMLFLPPGEPKPIRIQNAFVTTDEIERLIEHISQQSPFDHPYLSLRHHLFDSTSAVEDSDMHDELLHEARKLVIRHQQGSTSLLQRRLKIGFSRAGRLMDILEQEGVVGPPDGSKARKVLKDEDYLENFD